MSLTAAQKAIRATGIGASEVSAIAAINPYAAPIDVWLEKPTPSRGPLVEANDNDHPESPIAVGHELEGALLEMLGRVCASERLWGKAETYLLQSVGFFIDVPIFSDPVTAWIAIMLIDIWEWTPFMMLIMIAGLSSLPSEPIEAAWIDGARPAQILWHVQIPMLKPLIIVAVLFRTVDASKLFDSIYVLTGGGPGTDATSTITFFANKAIFGSWKLGYGAAICMVLGLLSLVAAAAFHKFISARKEA